MKKTVKVLLSIVLAGLFLWLAFRKVAFSDVLEASKQMSYGWLLPFTLITLLSHYFRALRWRYLFNKDKPAPPRVTLFTGVIFGYFANAIFPRLGEITRPVYVAKKIGESSSKLIGTIILERVIDVICMLLLMLFVLVFLVSDSEILSRLFGVDFTDSNIQINLIKGLILLVLSGIFIIGFFYFLLKWTDRKFQKPNSVYNKIRAIIKTFVDGLLAIKDLQNWGGFIFYTALIWLSYIAMTYIPFWMFDMHSAYGLTFADAIVLTVASAVGITIPTPGGIGTYHLFITKSLFLLYAVPEAIGLAYATITHATTIIIIFLATPILLSIDKYLSLKRESLSVKSTE